jgi:hypothetical protein
MKDIINQIETLQYKIVNHHRYIDIHKNNTNGLRYTCAFIEQQQRELVESNIKLSKLKISHPEYFI